MRWFVPFIVFLTLFAGCNQTPPPFKSTVVPPVEWGGNFKLTAHDGKPFDTAALAGKVQVLFFGFTHCPDICAPTLARLAQVKKALGPDSSRVQVLFVTVDPEHDTPVQLKKYLAGFDTTFIGLTGSVTETLAVQRDHKIFSEAEGSTFTHTSSLMVKDKQGRLKLVMNESLSVQEMADDLRLLISQ